MTRTNVSIMSYIIRGEETIFIMSSCTNFAVEIQVLDNHTYHCEPLGCYGYMSKVFFNRKEAITFAENWCSP